MPKVKAPGTDREIEFSLHEPDDCVTLLASVTTIVQSLDKVANYRKMLTVESPASRDAITEMARDAKSHEANRRAKLSGRTGRPRQVIGFTQAEDYAIVVLFCEAMGYKQAIKRTREYWKPAPGVEPARRHIEEALRRVRVWMIPDLKIVADATRKRYQLGPLPVKFTPRKRKRN